MGKLVDCKLMRLNTSSDFIIFSVTVSSIWHGFKVLSLYYELWFPSLFPLPNNNVLCGLQIRKAFSRVNLSRAFREDVFGARANSKHNVNKSM